jgi:hypothetical protein
MQANRRMVPQERLDLFGLVRREIIEDHMNRLPPRSMRREVGQERDELGRRVPFGGTAEDLSRSRVERRIKRQRAMPGVLKAVSFRAAWRQRQDRIQPIQRLDRGLLIDTEDRRVLRRVQIQSDNIGGLALKVGIVRRHVSLEPMRLEPMPGPDPGDHHMGEPERLRQPARTPMGRPILRPPARPVENPGLHLRGEHRGGLPAMSAVETRQSFGGKALAPARDVRIAATELPANLGPAGSTGEQQDAPGAPGIIGATLAAVDCGVPVSRRSTLVSVMAASLVDAKYTLTFQLLQSTSLALAASLASPARLASRADPLELRTRRSG